MRCSKQFIYSTPSISQQSPKCYYYSHLTEKDTEALSDLLQLVSGGAKVGTQVPGSRVHSLNLYIIMNKWVSEWMRKARPRGCRSKCCPALLPGGSWGTSFPPPSKLQKTTRVRTERAGDSSAPYLRLQRTLCRGPQTFLPEKGQHLFLRPPQPEASPFPPPVSPHWPFLPATPLGHSPDLSWAPSVPSQNGLSRVPLYGHFHSMAFQ